ncbi:diaminohydroxyphosphoribosylaminopyrimidine deaminase/5-amino-6-(5-phosphoribosylamino)uracil reductase [Rhodobium orientis]|uniref:Riboflavin biosynthesis protein RibD n=1 Tax=Rhodobium orientis TaxID=34017 RepID=A0A327JNZ5_9HYPH|nr:bifunctional diaminohydroxyphosphoribosylaminopyrimidine deaminase/5-amino-6-(5-phosphoribosylamino)uracil reductase RibD [Rhodobium orientis]MBB4304817.1 diaminohydroxyphosphoribosylaminopyrimidine deaminase/5-amino-6-(5-phosphoribosylamino)uracil reductase [Rhodobium orientis]MBK5948009.1 riboflavin biosynthesis protein RibD [Rhodobium orientis]RAI27445.1 riboflavin biosynthesis protein RibD [Rhodobium orientis]
MTTLTRSTTDAAAHAPRAPGSAIRCDADRDRRFMAAALGLARRGLGRTWPNPSVAAIIVAETDAGPVVVGSGVTAAGGRPHAEVVALAEAGIAARGATCYVTLEPCSHHGKSPPCSDALIAAGIARLVSAMEDPNPQVAGAGHRALEASGAAVTVGVGAAKARDIALGHILRVTEGRPMVTLKLAVSADGMIGRQGQGQVAITGRQARARVHLMRAEHDAIAVGIGTVLADDPDLTCRLPGMADRSPVRVVFDTNARLPLGSRMVQGIANAPVWAVVGEAAPEDRMEALQAAGVVVIAAPSGEGGHIDLHAALTLLAVRGLTSVMVEGGAALASSLLSAGLVDRAAIFNGPDEIGADGIAAPDMVRVGLAFSRFTETETRGFGPDLLRGFAREGD